MGDEHMTVALATIRKDAYEAMYDHLQTGAYAISTNNIHPVFTDNALAKEGFPQVIIKVRIKSHQLTIGQNPIIHAEIQYEIQSIHNSSENAKDIADEIWNKIYTGKQTLAGHNLYSNKENFSEDDYDMEYYAWNKIIHTYTQTFNFRYTHTQ